MEILSLQHAPEDIQQPLTADQLRAITARAFGPAARIESACELGGGEYNTIYRIALADREPVILRLAPHPEQWVPWHEKQLLRREHTIQPYFAPLGTLLPQTLFVDFTRELIERDYLFQTYKPGEQWLALARTLRPDEEEPLWRELARLTSTINAVEGDAFGYPYPGRRFTTWSACILDWLERTRHDIEQTKQDSAAAQAIRDIAAANTAALDEIARPRLLHGDLWTFNVLVAKSETAWHIAAVLDYDRAMWGDPLADWTFHLLPRRATPEVGAIFWEEYGKPEQTVSGRLRDLVYEGMHAGNVLADAGRRGDDRLITIARDVLRRVVAELHAV